MRRSPLSALGRGFYYALRGFCHCVKTQRNFRFHLAVVLHILLVSPFYRFTKGEWGLIFLACALVLGGEAVNTALEALVDGQYPHYSPVARRVKDVAAGAVLLFALGAAAVGLILFWDLDALERMGRFIAESPWTMLIPAATLTLSGAWVLGKWPKNR